jgi:hypothetical protein
MQNKALFITSLVLGQLSKDCVLEEEKCNILLKKINIFD